MDLKKKQVPFSEDTVVLFMWLCAVLLMASVQLMLILIGDVARLPAVPWKHCRPLAELKSHNAEA